MTVFVNATEVVCKNKDAHTSTPVNMELIAPRRAAKA